MASFDVYFKMVAEYLQELRNKKRQFKEINCQIIGDDYFQDLPIKVGEGAQQGVILKEDTGIELGNPRMGSSAFLLWTDNPSLIKDKKITLVGPDIQESFSNSLPFGQVLMIGGTSLKEEYHTTLEWGQYISDRIEGYMIRSIPQRIWSRVSKTAVERGFSFEVLGKTLMGIIKSELPLVESVEVLFVTSSRQDVEELETIAKQVEKISNDLKKRKFIVGDKGDYFCTNGLDCSVCHDKPVCDTIREQIVIRKIKMVD
jgi:CO dehydrogenase/acetyl-CoA synthase beta subunit